MQATDVLRACIYGETTTRDDCWNALNAAVLHLWTFDHIDEEQMENYLDRGNEQDQDTLVDLLLEIDREHNALHILDLPETERQNNDNDD